MTRIKVPGDDRSRRYSGFKEGVKYLTFASGVPVDTDSLGTVDAGTKA